MANAIAWDISFPIWKLIITELQFRRVRETFMQDHQSISLNKHYMYQVRRPLNYWQNIDLSWTAKMLYCEMETKQVH